MNRRSAIKRLGGILLAAGIAPSLEWAAPTPDYPPFTRVIDPQGRAFRYVRAAQDMYPGSLAALVNGNADVVPCALSGLSAAGVVVESIKSGDYGWIQTYGPACIQADDVTEYARKFPVAVILAEQNA